MANAAQAASIHLIQFCIQWSSLALIYYDYVLTFEMEVRYIWGRKFRISTILYYFCRYSLVANVIYLLTISNKITKKYDIPLWIDRSFFSNHEASCSIGYVACSALGVLGRLAVVTVWTARTYAVFGKNIWILAFFSTTGLMIMILDIIDIPAKNSCSGSTKLPIDLLSIMMVVFEILAASFTTFRTVQALNVNGHWWRRRRGLHYLVLEQGVLYFCSVTMLTITNLVLNSVLPPGGFFQRLLNAYTIPLSGLMTARCLLHLRKYDELRTGGSFDPDQDASAGIKFGTYELHSHMLTTKDDLELKREVHSPSFADQFGEDPVQQATILASQNKGRPKP